ncbi:hypothetical protein M758_1G163200 [Ceratodon purpureus]|nr:hypothetical protein M758_1G163200 [Ceratodon purpureus]
MKPLLPHESHSSFTHVAEGVLRGRERERKRAACTTAWTWPGLASQAEQPSRARSVTIRVCFMVFDVVPSKSCDPFFEYIILSRRVFLSFLAGRIVVFFWFVGR